MRGWERVRPSSRGRPGAARAAGRRQTAGQGQGRPGCRGVGSVPTLTWSTPSIFGTAQSSNVVTTTSSWRIHRGNGGESSSQSIPCLFQPCLTIAGPGFHFVFIRLGQGSNPFVLAPEILGTQCSALVPGDRTRGSPSSLPGHANDDAVKPRRWWVSRSRVHGRQPGRFRWRIPVPE